MPVHLRIAVFVLLLLAPGIGAAQDCAGDCDGDGQVTRTEIAETIAALFGAADCAAADADGSGTVTAADLLRVVRAHAEPPCAPPTVALPSPTPTHTPGGTPASQWAALTPLPRGPRQEVGVAALDGRIAVVGGLTDTGQGSAEVELYDPVAGQWTRAAALPDARHHVGAATLDGLLYVIGGFLGRSFQPDAGSYRYDPGTDEWTAIAPLPRARGALAVAAAAGRLHAVGGSAASGSSVTDHTIYDPVTDTWAPAAPLPGARNHLAAAAIDDRLYVVGGRGDAGGTANSAALHRYDADRDAWDALAPMPTARSGHAAAVFAGLLVVLGGEVNPDRPDGVFVEVELYDPETDRWTGLDPMPVPRHGIGAVTVGGLIYIPGGATRAGFAATAHADALRIGDR